MPQPSGLKNLAECRARLAADRPKVIDYLNSNPGTFAAIFERLSLPPQPLKSALLNAPDDVFAMIANLARMAMIEVVLADHDAESRAVAEARELEAVRAREATIAGVAANRAEHLGLDEPLPGRVALDAANELIRANTLGGPENMDEEHVRAFDDDLDDDEMDKLTAP